MEMIVAVVREVTLCGPRGADSRPDLSILHTAQPLPRCNYLSHCELVCVCVCLGGKGVVGESTWPDMQPNPVFPLNGMKGGKAQTEVHCTPTWDPDSPGPSPFLAPSNYLWAHGGLGTIVCCLHSTQSDAELMHTQPPLWLGLTAASFAWRDGGFHYPQ